MGRRVGVVALALLSFAAGSAFAQKGPRLSKPTIISAGTRSCAQFAADYKKNPELVGAIYGTWADGFLVGLNIGMWGNHIGPKDIASVTADQRQSEIRNRCDQQPFKAYWEAVIDYWNGLPFAN